ncbi:MAG: uracil-DNA glycosylase [Betaproteobacteria bacterium]|nr:uracil-DNA glycosylase [Betaproteobacteria bacterium]
MLCPRPRRRVPRRGSVSLPAAGAVRACSGWFRDLGLDEAAFRSRVYMAAVCRCFPGKNPGGGDRVPDATEIRNCSNWLEAELRLLEPHLVIPVGRLAIAQFLAAKRLDSVVGTMHVIRAHGFETDLIPLPHPSGASVWHRVEPGRTLLAKALELIGSHPAWRSLLPEQGSNRTPPRSTRIH